MIDPIIAEAITHRGGAPLEAVGDPTKGLLMGTSSGACVMMSSLMLIHYRGNWFQK
jgi:hypothetical protein